MRVLLFVIMTLFFSFSAQAYIEENKSNKEAKATAGEQNSSLYRLNATSTIRLKKLRKIDEVLARNPNATIADEADMEDLLSNRKQVDLDNQNQLTQMYQETIKRTKQKKTLIETNDKSYQQINEIALNSVKDLAAVRNIKQKIGRR